MYYRPLLVIVRNGLYKLSRAYIPLILPLNDYNGFVVLDMCVLHSICTPGTHSLCHFLRIT